MKILYPGNPLDENELLSLEERLQTRLPNDYRSFLLHYNGGIPDPGDFLIADGLGYSTVSQLFGLSAELDTGNILWYLHVPEDTFPPDLLRIGISPGGQYICISLADINRDKIFFWDYEMGLHSSTTGYSNPFLLANSFSEFLSKLLNVESNTTLMA